jgi:Ca2+/Na+ antiporter
MMNKNSLSPLRPMIIVFVLLNAFFISGRNMLANWGVDQPVVITGNLILFAVTLISFLLSQRSLKSDNPNVFIRAMYANVMIKLFVCIAAAFIYFTAAKKNINKPGLFTCMGLYAVYTVIEVSSLTKLLRKKKNA